MGKPPDNNSKHGLPWLSKVITRGVLVIFALVCVGKWINSRSVEDGAAARYEKETAAVGALLRHDIANIKTNDELKEVERKIYRELVDAYMDMGKSRAEAEVEALRDFRETGRATDSLR